MSDVPIKGRARLLVDKMIIEHAPVKIEIPRYGQVAWRVMEVQELFDVFQSFLLLPDQYEIIGVYFDTVYGYWTLLLESACIPIPEKGMELPLLMPMYYIENGKVGVSEFKFI